ncbi:hypothetical protein D3C76_1530810 [compost metagenome]
MNHDAVTISSTSNIWSGYMASPIFNSMRQGADAANLGDSVSIVSRTAIDALGVAP